MTEKIQITRFNRYNQKPDGSPMISSKGDHYSKVKITDQKGRNITVLDWNNLTNNWTEGSEVELLVEEQRTPDGKVYFKGTIPGAKNKYNESMSKMAEEIHWIFLKLGGGDSTEANKVINAEAIPAETTADSELPF